MRTGVRQCANGFMHYTVQALHVRSSCAQAVLAGCGSPALASAFASALQPQLVSLQTSHARPVYLVRTGRLAPIVIGHGFHDHCCRLCWPVCTASHGLTARQLRLVSVCHASSCTAPERTSGHTPRTLLACTRMSLVRSHATRSVGPCA